MLAAEVTMAQSGGLRSSVHGGSPAVCVCVCKPLQKKHSWGPMLVIITQSVCFFFFSEPLHQVDRLSQRLARQRIGGCQFARAETQSEGQLVDCQHPTPFQSMHYFWPCFRSDWVLWGYFNFRAGRAIFCGAKNQNGPCPSKEFKQNKSLTFYRVGAS